MNKLIILISILFFNTLANAQQCSELFFSEYVEGSGSDKAIEIYNPTKNSINLSDYVVIQYNRSNSGNYSTFYDTLSGTINTYSTFVIADPSASAAITSDYTSTIARFNGNDALGLHKISTNTIIDIIGPSSTTMRGDTAIKLNATDSMKEMTLVRDHRVLEGDIIWSSNSAKWTPFPQNTFSNLGTHLCDCDTDTSAGFSPSTITINENQSGSFLIEVVFNKPFSINQTINLNLISGDATRLKTTFPASFSVNAGSKKATFVVETQDNTIQDGDADISFGFSGINSNTKKTADSVFNLTIIDDEAPSEVSVKSQFAFTKYEGNKDAYIDIVLDKPTKNAASVNYTISGVNSGAVVSQDLTNFQPHSSTISFNAGDSAVRLTFDIIKDAVTESTDTFLFKLLSPRGLTINTAKEITNFYVKDSSESGITGRPYYKIGTIRGGNMGNTPDSVGVQCSIRGRIYGNNTRRTGYQMVVCDETGCIGIFSGKEYTQFKDEKEGDSVEVTGTVSHFRGYGQMRFDGAFDTIKKFGYRAIGTPKTVVTLNESTESHLVKLEKLKLKSGSWQDSSNFNLVMSSADNPSNEYEIRILNFDNRFGTFNLIESGKIYDISGLGGQFDTTSTLSGGYQLLPRYEVDIKESSDNTGAVSHSRAVELRIYPNPVNLSSPVIHLISNKYLGNCKLTLTNTIGEKIFTEYFQILKGENSIRFNKSLSKGIYILNIESNSLNLDEIIAIE